MLAILARNPIATGLGALAALLGLLLGIQTVRLALAQNEVQAEKLAMADFKRQLAEETLRVEREAKATSDQKIKELAEEVRSVGLVASQAKTEVRVVSSNGGPCDRDPAYLGGIRGAASVLEAGRRADGGQGAARP